MKSNRIHLRTAFALVTLCAAAAPFTQQVFAGTQTRQSPAVKTVSSRDGTTIAFEQSGGGPVVILVSSALSGRVSGRRLAALLAPSLTVICYDRRGRGDSGDTQPYSIQREIEDLEALIDHAGGSAMLFGASSGAVLALDAASKLPNKVSKVVMYEAPFVVDDTRPPVPEDFVARVTQLVASGHRDQAVEYFMVDAVGVPPDAVAQMRKQPMWAGMEKLAHTLAYDGMVMGDTQSGKPLPANRWESATMPVLVMSGGASDAWLQDGSKSVAKLLPNATHRTLEGQDHSAPFTAPQAISPVIIEFFTR
ncbi:MAG: alpha/beta fold hydrolase [Tepidisphaeraceae bacterium]